jgi:hypothetical protein
MAMSDTGMRRVRRRLHESKSGLVAYIRLTETEDANAVKTSTYASGPEW